MRTIIRKSALAGSIVPPSSKSHTMRAILLGSLAQGRSVITEYLSSKDTEKMIAFCRGFGAKITAQKDTLTIEGTAGKVAFTENKFDVGNSGILLRFGLAIAALSKKEVILTGDHSIQTLRKIDSLVVALRALGAQVTYLKQPGYAPVSIRGPLQPKPISVDGSDSQFVSALLFLGSCLEEGLELSITNPKEIPWIDMTLWWLDVLKVSYINDHYTKIQIKKHPIFSGFSFCVPKDFSSASYFLFLCTQWPGSLFVKGLNRADPQGDKKIIALFEKMGAQFCEDAAGLHVGRAYPLQGIEVDMDQLIDALPLLAVACTQASTPSYLYNAQSARYKECDRISCIAKELSKMGARIEETTDTLRIYPSSLQGAHVRSYHDHRMAMSLSIAGLLATGDTVIEEAGCVEKTYADFFDQLLALGAQVSTENQVQV